MDDFDPRVLLDRIEDKAQQMDQRYKETGRLNRKQVDQLQQWVSGLYTALGIQRQK